MIELIPNLPDGMVGLKLSGRIDANDYNETITPAIETALMAHKKINVLVLVDGAGVDFSPGAAVRDVKVGLGRPFSWNKVALVSDSKWLDGLIPVFSALIPGEMKSFGLEELNAAREWLNSGS